MSTELHISRTTNLGDFKELVLVFEKVFAMNVFILPPDAHLGSLLEKENFYAVIAKFDNRIIGGLTGYVLDPYYSEKPLFYIYDLAVLNEYQRTGVGSALIAYINGYCRQKGFQEVFVQADTVDDYALRFYRSTKPTEEEDVRHFYYTL